MLTKEQKIAKLRHAIELLMDVDQLQQEVITGDVCQENHNRLQDLIDDFRADLIELDS